MNSDIKGSGRLALVIGASGAIGGETARALLAHGWRVRALTRDPAKQRASAGAIEWVKGDAMQRSDVLAAAKGAAVIFHGANPPRYENWATLVLPMLESSIAAAKASGARLLVPGNVYNYGPDALPVLSEDSPQHPLTRKGKVRVAMEEALKTAAHDGVRSLILRAGDFFGPRQPASWVKNMMVTPGKPVTSVIYPGKPNVGHAWAYLPDLAETFAQLADREQALPAFDTFHFGGHWAERGVDFADAIRRVAGKPKAPIKPLPLWFHLATPFVGFLREAREMRYLWEVPVKLDNAKLRALLGSEPVTPLDEAIATTLRDYGCLPREAPKR